MPQYLEASGVGARGDGGVVVVDERLGVAVVEARQV